MCIMPTWWNTVKSKTRKTVPTNGVHPIVWSMLTRTQKQKLRDMSKQFWNSYKFFNNPKNKASMDRTKAQHNRNMRLAAQRLAASRR